MTTVRSAVLYRVERDLPRPFVHAAATRTRADGLVLLIDFAGVEGVGECVPRPYVTGESPESAFAAITALDLAALGEVMSAGDLAEVVRGLEGLGLAARLGPAAACAVELAALDAAARRFERSLDDLAALLHLPEEMRAAGDGSTPINVSRTLDLASSPADVVPGPHGTAHVKIKVGTDWARDLARIEEVRAHVGDACTISLDANMAWDLADAIARLRRLEPLRIAWVEEPLAARDFQAYRALREATGARIMLDESLCSFQDGRNAVAERACDLFNIRISKCGGLIASMRLAELAFRSDLGFQLGAHPGQMGVLGAAGARFVRAVRGAVTTEGVGMGGPLGSRIIRELMRFDPRRGLVLGLGEHGLGVSAERTTIERLATARALWDGARWT